MTEQTCIDDELNTVFGSGKVFSATDEDLNRYLQHLASGYVRNEMVRHRETNRCQIINTIKTFRLIDKLEQKNDVLQKSNKFLTYLAIILGIGSFVMSIFAYWQAQDVAKESGDQLDRWMAIQKLNQEKLLELQGQQLKVLQTMSTFISRTRKAGVPAN